MRNFILGTDWWTDCDDAAAISILARAHKDGKICVRGIGINACMEYSVKSLFAFLRSEGVGNIPIGIDLEATDFGGRPPYQKRLAELYPDSLENGDVPDAVKLYRKVLSEAETPIEIIEIGYPQVLANLLESGADEFSDKDGTELVRRKVSKIWVMAGKWDENPGKENNFARNARSSRAGKIFCEKCPVPVTFLGWETACNIISGGELKDGDILKNIFTDHGSPNGRSSWDPCLVLLAIDGDEEKAGYGTVCGKASVDEATGENRFSACCGGMHKYVVKKMPDEYYKNRINSLIN